MNFLVTMTTSLHSGIVSSSATTAPPTCPVPPRIIAAKFCFINQPPLARCAPLLYGTARNPILRKARSLSDDHARGLERQGYDDDSCNVSGAHVADGALAW